MTGLAALGIAPLLMFLLQLGELLLLIVVEELSHLEIGFLVHGLDALLALVARQARVGEDFLARVEKVAENRPNFRLLVGSEIEPLRQGLKGLIYSRHRGRGGRRLL